MIALRVRGLVVFGAVVGMASHARAERMVQQMSFWNASHTTIYSDVVIEDDDGTLHTQRIVGGSVDGIGMVQRAVGIASFVRTQSAAGTPLRWPGSCVWIYPATDGTTHLPDDQERDVMTDVVATWKAATSACSNLRLVIGNPVEREVGLDGVNVIKFRETEWCRPSDPPQCYDCRPSDPPHCYDSAVLATTTVTYVSEVGPRYGEILDADIEINATFFSISSEGLTLGQELARTDLANVLTHEIGHVVGLDHPCWDGVSTTMTDDQGNALPLCNDPTLPTVITEATMFPSQEPDETKRASLEADDIAGYCAAYPAAATRPVCSSQVVGGCRAAPSTAGWALLASSFLLRRRRRST